MKSSKSILSVAVLSLLVFAATVPSQAQKYNFRVPSYTPPRYTPAPRPAPRPEPVYRAPETPRPEPRVEHYDNTPRQNNVPMNNSPSNNFSSNNAPSNDGGQSRPSVGNSQIPAFARMEPHSNFSVVRPAAVPRFMARAMTYNRRHAIFVRNDYFVANYGAAHAFHINFFTEHGVSVFNPDFMAQEPYFQFGGFWFGLLGPIPTNWRLALDNLYIDVGDDGNYYLYDAAFPGLAIQLSAGVNIGDDQADNYQDPADQDQ